MKEFDILKEIGNSKGYEICLMTSFNFEIPFFERSILNKLVSNGVKDISLYIDRKQFNEAFEKDDASYLGVKYIINPIEMNASFHPKLILFLSNDRAKLIIGSGNIKASGFCLNNEVFNVFEYSKKDLSNLNIIKDAIKIFNQIDKISYKLDKQIINKMNLVPYIDINTTVASHKLISNYDNKIIDQLDIKDKINKIKIAVPYYDDELRCIKEIKKTFNCDNIELYIQNIKSTFPIKYNEQYKVINNNNIKIFDQFISNNSKNFYHGKVFEFITDNNAYIIYGSANCTSAAFTTSYIKGGNFEAVVIEKGEVEEFDYFFNDMINTSPGEKFKSVDMKYTTNGKNNYTFLYSFLENNTIMAKIKFVSNKNDLKIEYNGTSLEYDKENKILNVKIPINLINEYDKNIILEFSFDGELEKLKCWYIDYSAIIQTRNAIKLEKNIYDVEDNVNSINMNDYYLLTSTMFMNFDEQDKYIQLKKRYDQKINNNDDEDNYIVEIENDNSDYIYKLREQQEVERLVKNIFNHLYNKMVVKNNKNYNQEKQKSKEEKDGNDKESRKALPEEKRFERFFKSRIKGIIDENYIAIVDAKQYLQNITIILNIFDKYKYDEKIEDIFEGNYIDKTKIMLFDIIVNKEDFLTLDEKEYDFIITNIMILNLEQSNLMDLNYKPSLECKKLLNKYNKIINIRDDYEKYVIAATTYLNNYDFSASITYIENLFDYKEPSKINQELEEKYKQKIEYKHENCETISYTIYKKNLFNTRQIDLAIFNLLRKNWITLDENIKTVIVEFKLKEEYYKKEFPKELITEKYVIMLYLNKIIRYRYRKDGSEDETFILKNIK